MAKKLVAVNEKGDLWYIVGRVTPISGFQAVLETLYKETNNRSFHVDTENGKIYMIKIPHGYKWWKEEITKLDEC